MSRLYFSGNLLGASGQPNNSPKWSNSLSHLYQPHSVERKKIQDTGIFSEARDLLNQWVVKSLLNDGRADSDNSDIDLPLNVPSRLEVKKEWDHLLNPTLGEKSQFCMDRSSIKLARSKIRIGSKLKQTVYGVDRLSSSRSNHEKAKPSTLDRILQRQEEARARRELRLQEKRERQAEAAIRKEAEREALEMAKQLDETAKQKQKREEELIQKEMIRVRKQLEVEKERVSRERCRQWLTTDNQMNSLEETTHPSSPVYHTDRQCSPEFDGTLSKDPVSSSDDGSCHDTTLGRRDAEDKLIFSGLYCSDETGKLLRRYLTSWKQQINHSRVRMQAITTRYELRLQRKVLRIWRSTVSQIRFDREVEQANTEIRDIERKQTQAIDFYMQRLKSTSFLRWHTALKLSKMQHEQEERDKQRRLKEIEFLERLRSNPSALDETQLRSVESEWNSQGDLNIPYRRRSFNTKNAQTKRRTPRSGTDPMIFSPPASSLDSHELPSLLKPQRKLIRSALERPSLPKTLIQQRQRIAEQNREIEELRSAKRYAELMLEARARVQPSTSVKKKALSARGSCNFSDMQDGILENNQCEPKKSTAGHDTDSVCRSQSTRITYAQSHKSQSMRMEPEDENCILNGNVDVMKSKMPSVPCENQFVKRMEERAAERARLKAERDERRRLAEIKKQEEAARQLEEEAQRIKEEKRVMLEAQRAKKRDEEARQQERLRRLALMEALTEKANQHLKHQRLVYYGWLPWKRLLIRQRALLQTAEYHAKFILMRTVILTWVEYRRTINKSVTEFAQCAYDHMLIRKAFTGLQLACDLKRKTEQRAYVWYEQQLMRRALSNWSTHITEIRIWDWQLEDVAKAHWFSLLKRRCLTAWLQYPQLMRDERERERRLERLRSTLRDVVPDFSPPEAEKSPL
ncbi:hypothetical protein D915_009171 [Fasciola hepatica]|uniref:Coiled-coil domain-containing protein n=1 Tax=Fasciola hepatica TaxID=6192 RepID=A0A4E0QXX2_FASHE|nr:hypothetical protein D915_009171 [Fasciola hepatica]